LIPASIHIPIENRDVIHVLRLLTSEGCPKGGRNVTGALGPKCGSHPGSLSAGRFLLRERDGVVHIHNRARLVRWPHSVLGLRQEERQRRPPFGHVDPDVAQGRVRHVSDSPPQRLKHCGIADETLRILHQQHRAATSQDAVLSWGPSAWTFFHRTPQVRPRGRGPWGNSEDAAQAEGPDDHRKEECRQESLLHSWLLLWLLCLPRVDSCARLRRAGCCGLLLDLEQRRPEPAKHACCWHGRRWHLFFLFGRGRSICFTNCICQTWGRIGRANRVHGRSRHLGAAISHASPRSLYLN
jgi:hypothetical protein